MFSSILFLLFGLWLSIGSCVVAKDMILNDKATRKIGDLPVMGIGLILGGFLTWLGGGGLYYDLKGKKHSDPVKDEIAHVNQVKINPFRINDFPDSIDIIHRLINDGIETTAQKSSEVISSPIESGNRNKTLVETYSFSVGVKFFELKHEMDAGEFAPILPRSIETIYMVYLPSDPRVAMPGTKQSLAATFKSMDSASETAVLE